MKEKAETAHRIRTAGVADIAEIVRITNLAYEVERPLIRGNRTDSGEVAERMREGCFLVMEADAGADKLCGSVFFSVAQGRGYLGMLAIDPALQGHGLASRLIAAVEASCLEAGCPFLDLTVLSPREELFGFYRHHGFAESGKLPYPRPDLLLRSLHMVQMTKALRRDNGP